MIIGIRHSPVGLWLTAAIALPLASLPLAAPSSGMEVALCTADGAGRTVTIPLDRRDGDDRCAKPCHACLSRKKGMRNR